MIENTNTKQKLIEFQQSRKLGTYGFEKGKVTKGWWKGFLRRNENKLVNKRGENFGSEFRRETFGLAEPAVHHALRADDQGAKRFFNGTARLRGGVGVGLVQEPGEGLHGFAQAHVVGENATKLVRAEIGEEVKAFVNSGIRNAPSVPQVMIDASFHQIVGSGRSPISR